MDENLALVAFGSCFVVHSKNVSWRDGHAIDLETRSVAFSVADVVVSISVCHASPFKRR